MSATDNVMRCPSSSVPGMVYQMKNDRTNFRKKPELATKTRVQFGSISLLQCIVLSSTTYSNGGHNLRKNRRERTIMIDTYTQDGANGYGTFNKEYLPACI